MKITDEIERLKLELPQVYQAVMCQGVMIERERVLAHLRVAAKYDSLDEAVEAVEIGAPAHLIPGEIIPYTLLHDRYALIQDERGDYDIEPSYSCR